MGTINRHYDFPMPEKPKSRKKVDLYQLKLHQSELVSGYYVMRVPGGWIYQLSKGDIFVPFNNEFQETLSL